MDQHVKHQVRMTVPESLGPGGMVMAGGTTHGEWGQSSPTPSKVKDVCSSLRFANFYQQFISNYSTIACPLIDLTKKSIPWNWIPLQQLTFDSLECLFLSKPVLHIPDLSSPFTIATDAFKYVLGAILLQTDSNGEWYPCSYLSQSFSLVECNYDIYDCKLLAIIHALKAWQHNLHGSPFPIQVFTNHKNLTYFHKPQVLNHQQAHWLLDLADFDLTMIHVPSLLPLLKMRGLPFFLPHSLSTSLTHHFPTTSNSPLPPTLLFYKHSNSWMAPSLWLFAPISQIGNILRAFSPTKAMSTFPLIFSSAKPFLPTAMTMVLLAILAI